jgi:hypothetical protein
MVTDVGTQEAEPIVTRAESNDPSEEPEMVMGYPPAAGPLEGEIEDKEGGLKLKERKLLT